MGNKNVSLVILFNGRVKVPGTYSVNFSDCCTFTKEEWLSSINNNVVEVRHPFSLRLSILDVIHCNKTHDVWKYLSFFSVIMYWNDINEMKNLPWEDSPTEMSWCSTINKLSSTLVINPTTAIFTVILLTWGCLPNACLGTPPRADTPPPGGHCSGQYASYWNTFLFCWIETLRTNIN